MLWAVNMKTFWQNIVCHYVPLGFTFCRLRFTTAPYFEVRLDFYRFLAIQKGLYLKCGTAVRRDILLLPIQYVAWKRVCAEKCMPTNPELRVDSQGSLLI